MVMYIHPSSTPLILTYIRVIIIIFFMSFSVPRPSGGLCTPLGGFVRQRRGYELSILSVQSSSVEMA